MCKECAGTGAICANSIAKCEAQLWSEGKCGCTYKDYCPGDSKIICPTCNPDLDSKKQIPLLDIPDA